MEMSRLTWDGTAETVSQDQILRHERGQGNINFPCSADHEQDWQHYPVDLHSSYVCDHTDDSTYKIKFSGACWDKEKLVFPVQFTTGFTIENPPLNICYSCLHYLLPL